MDKPKKKKSPEKKEFKITEKGSLGLLALGDVGLEAWRAVRDKKKSDA